MIAAPLAVLVLVLVLVFGLVFLGAVFGLVLPRLSVHTAAAEI